MSGSQYVFNIEQVSLLDINRLIEADRRFTLLSDTEYQDFDDLEEYYGRISATVPK